MITVDGVKWDLVTKIERTAEVSASEISGLMLDKTYFADVIGTYMRYEMSIAVPPGMERDYSDLYELLTQPVSSHTFTIPYSQSTLEIAGRVESVTDTLYTIPGKRGAVQRWKGIEFSVIANHPTKSIDLGEAVSRGFAQLPEAIDIPVGTLYEATSAGWVEVEYEDADAKEY
jgi:hypothetical protein